MSDNDGRGNTPAVSNCWTPTQTPRTTGWWAGWRGRLSARWRTHLALAAMVVGVMVALLLTVQAAALMALALAEVLPAQPSHDQASAFAPLRCPALFLACLSAATMPVYRVLATVLAPAERVLNPITTDRSDDADDADGAGLIAVVLTTAAAASMTLLTFLFWLITGHLP